MAGAGLGGHDRRAQARRGLQAALQVGEGLAAARSGSARQSSSSTLPSCTYSRPVAENAAVSRSQSSNSYENAPRRGQRTSPSSGSTVRAKLRSRRTSGSGDGGVSNTSQPS